MRKHFKGLRQSGMFKSMKEDGFTKEMLRLLLVNILSHLSGNRYVDTSKSKKRDEASSQENVENSHYRENTIVHKGV